MSHSNFPDSSASSVLSVTIKRLIAWLQMMKRSDAKGWGDYHKPKNLDLVALWEWHLYAHVLHLVSCFRKCFIWRCWFTCRWTSITLSLIVFLTHPPALCPFKRMDSIAQSSNTQACSSGNIPVSSRTWKCRVIRCHICLSFPSICPWKSISIY